MLRECTQAALLACTLGAVFDARLRAAQARDMAKAVLLDGCVVGQGSIVAAGALVPPGRIIPPGSLVMGVPGKMARAVTEAEMAETLSNAEHYVQLGREELPPVDGE